MARILLVEDDIDVCTVFEQILLDAEHEVDSSETFRGGSELIGSRDYDLVIADGRLKDGTGAMLADIARNKGIPALIVTGDATILRHSAAVDFLRYRWLLKPVRPQTLVEAVAAALRDRAAPH
jgi:DNA-binding NtrC family response regulator